MDPSTGRRGRPPLSAALAAGALGLTLLASRAGALSITGEPEPPASIFFQINMLVIPALVALIWPTLGVAMLAAAAGFSAWWAAIVLRPGSFGPGLLQAPETGRVVLGACAAQLLAALVLPFLAGFLLRSGWTRARAFSLCAALAAGGFAAAGGWRLEGPASAAVAAGLMAAAAVSALLASGKRPPAGPPRPDLSRAKLFTRLEDGALAVAPLGMLGRRFIVPPGREAELKSRFRAVQLQSLALTIAIQAPWIFCLITDRGGAALALFLLGAAATVQASRWTIARSEGVAGGLQPCPWPAPMVGDFLRWVTLSFGAPLAGLVWCYGLSGMLGPTRESLKREGLSLAALAREVGARRGVAGNLRRLAIGALLLWITFWGWAMMWRLGMIGAAVWLVAGLTSLAFVLGLLFESALGLAACRPPRA